MISWKKYTKIGPHGLAALLVIALAMLIRIALIAQGWPSTNSDEGTMGVMALHIAYRGEWPAFLYGQSYMGVLEAYIAALLFHLLGPSLFSLRLAMLLLFASFQLVMYLLMRLLYTKNVALISIIVLSLGSPETYTRQLKAVGGALETQLFGALILLLATHLVLIAASQSARPRLRLIVAGSLGLAMGLGIWSHMLILPFVLTALLFFVYFCRSELRTKTIISLATGLLLGLLPLILYNVTLAQVSQNVIGTFLGNFLGSSSHAPYNFWYQIVGTLAISLPLAIGASPLYLPSSDPEKWQASLPALFPQLIWGIGFLFLWVLAVVLTIRSLQSYRRSLPLPYTLEQRQILVRYSARLMLLASALLTLLAFLVSPTSAQVPVTSARYLIGLLVALPALIVPFYLHISSRVFAPRLLFGTLIKIVVLIFISVVLINSTRETFQQIPTVQAVNQKDERLINELLRIHAVHIYSDYWTCNRLIFESNERIICSVLDEKLRPGQNRYQPYQTLVQQDEQATYVFSIDGSQNAAYMQTSSARKRVYHYFAFEGYAIYQPVSANTSINHP